MEKVHNQKTKSKRSIETDYDMPVPDQKESDKILYKRIKDWYNSLTKQELEDYENLYNTTEDAYGKILISLFEIKGKEDKNKITKIFSTYKRFKNVPIEKIELNIALPANGWGKFHNNDHYLRIIAAEEQEIKCIPGDCYPIHCVRKLTLISPSDANDILKMFHYEGGIFRYIKN